MLRNAKRRCLSPFLETSIAFLGFLRFLTRYFLIVVFPYSFMLLSVPGLFGRGGTTPVTAQLQGGEIIVQTMHGTKLIHDCGFPGSSCATHHNDPAQIAEK